MSDDLKITAFHLYFERFPALVLRRVAVGARGARAVSQGKAQDAPFLYGPTWLLLRPQQHGMRRPVLCSMLGGAYRVVKPRAPTSAATSGLRADRRFRLGARFFIAQNAPTPHPTLWERDVGLEKSTAQQRVTPPAAGNG